VGLCATPRPLLFRSLVTALQELGEAAVGYDVSEPERLHAALVDPENFFGPGGVLSMAAAAIDMGVWDLIGRDAGRPLWQLLGGAASRVRTYDSGTLVPGLSLDELQTAAAGSVAAGHRAMKMRPGPDRDGPVAAVVARVAAVREAVGPDIDLMIDINQGWTPSRSIALIRALEPLGLTWVEDPTRMTDVAGLAAVAAAVTTPLCAGEYYAGPAPLLRLLQERAVDILMIDLMRVGGVTSFRHIASSAALFEVPIVSHLFPELNAHLLAAVPNGYMAEYMPWTRPLFETVPEVTDGWLNLGPEPGFGVRLDHSFVGRHRIS
jgi:L-alanine-DL-glutamate epimerase-like enolase superfamily enzyme